jgi:heme A synthase
VAALALYGVLQAVDGVALKQAVNAWADASDTEKPARFASAEAIRWIEWGVRSYQDFALALALLLAAAAVVRTDWIPRPLAYLIALAGLAYAVQGWVVGSEGFSPTHSAAIVLAWVLNLTWMVWLLIFVRRRHDSGRADDGVNRPAAL